MRTIDKNISILRHEFDDEFKNSQSNKYIVLDIFGGEYAIEIGIVADIAETVKTIMVPVETAGTKLFIEHKCRFIPALSLRKILNLPEAKEQTAVIININQTQRALIVDRVIDIEDIDIDNSEKFAPENSLFRGDFIKTACRVNGVVKNFFDIEKLFSIQIYKKGA